MFLNLRHIFVCSVIFVAAGCQTPLSQKTAYHGNLPVLISIPFDGVLRSENTSSYPAQIALPSDRDFTTNRIEVSVNGAVASPGVVRLRSDSTVLESINAAGGFAPWAYAKKIHVTGSGHRQFVLYLHSRPLAGTHFKMVWCDTNKLDNVRGLISDYGVSAGDKISIRTATY